MTTERSFSFTPNVVTGAGVMGLGIVLLLHNLGAMDARALLPYWPLFLIVFGASVVVQALQGRPTGPAERPLITPGFVLFAAMAVVVVSYLHDRRDSTADGDIKMFAVMSAGDQAHPAQPFRGGEITTLMGRTRLDLRTAELAPGQTAVIDIFNVMSRTDIRVPPGWAIDVQAVRAMAGVRDARPRTARPEHSATSPDPDLVEPSAPDAVSAPPRLVVRGFVMMGGLTVSN